MNVAVSEVAAFLTAGVPSIADPDTWTDSSPSRRDFKGTDTTGHALTYISYEVARRPDVWRALRTELSAMPNESLFDIDLLRALPYLNAFIRVRVITRDYLSVT